MDSKNLAKLQALDKQPIKVIGKIDGLIGATRSYYVKCPVRAKLGQVLALLAPATNVAKAITVSKATLSAATTRFNDLEVKLFGGSDTVPVDISSTALLTGNTATSASALTLLPAANYTESNIIIEPNQCIKISIADPTGTSVITGQIVVEFIPA